MTRSCPGVHALWATRAVQLPSFCCTRLHKVRKPLNSSIVVFEPRQVSFLPLPLTSTLVAAVALQIVNNPLLSTQLLLVLQLSICCHGSHLSVLISSVRDGEQVILCRPALRPNPSCSHRHHSMGGAHRPRGIPPAQGAQDCRKPSNQGRMGGRLGSQGP